jgi:hypothetical protein
MTKTQQPLAAEHLHCVDRAVIEQTVEESRIEHSFEFDTFTIHHGIRYDAPVVIVEPADRTALGAIWYDQTMNRGRA